MNRETFAAVTTPMGPHMLERCDFYEEQSYPMIKMLFVSRGEITVHQGEPDCWVSWTHETHGTSSSIEIDVLYDGVTARPESLMRAVNAYLAEKLTGFECYVACPDVGWRGLALRRTDATD